MSLEIVQSNICLPIGKFIASDSGTVELLIPVNRISEYALAKFFQLSNQFIDNGDNLLWPQLKSALPIAGNWVLEFSISDDTLIPLSEVVGLWRQNLKVKFPVIIQFVHKISKIFYDNHYHQSLLSPCPLSIYLNPNNENNNWKLLAIPSFDFPLVDWANTDVTLFEWFPLEIGMEKEKASRYFVGIILHYCFAGNIFSDLMTPREIIIRCLQNRLEVSGNLEKNIIHALSEDLEEEGEKLAASIEYILNYKDTIEPSLKVEDLATIFSVYRIATKWEYEEHLNIAIQILEDGDYQLSDVLARLYAKSGHRKKALKCYLDAVHEGNREAFKEVCLQLLAIAKQDANFKEDALFKEVDEAINKDLYKTENRKYRLQLAYLNLRYFKDIEQAKGFLIDKKETLQKGQVWEKTLSTILKTYIFYKQEKFATVSKLCEEGINYLANYSNTTSNDLRLEAKMYFQLMNGIAHISAVGKLKDYFYLKDAISWLTGALDTAIQLDSQEMINTSFHWLNFLKNFAIYFPPQISPIIQFGIDAYIHIKKGLGVDFPEIEKQLPELPWFQEHLFFSQKNDFMG